MQAYDREDVVYYDYYSTGVDGDVQFYVDQAKKAGSPILELGCGTGRILIPVAQAGLEAVGLDLSPPMLEKTRTKTAELDSDTASRIKLIEGDMRTFTLDKKFKLIMIPYRAFLHLLTDRDQKEALTNIHKHLAPEGILVLNIFDPRLDLLLADKNQLGAELRKGPDFFHPELGNHVVTWYTAQHDFEKQIMEVYNIFEEIDKSGKVIAKNYISLTLRFIFRYEMQHLLNLCGFEVLHLYGDFDCSPFQYGGEQIWIAKKK